MKRLCVFLLAIVVFIAGCSATRIKTDVKIDLPQEEILSYGTNIRFEYKQDGNNGNKLEGWASTEKNLTWTVGNDASFFVYVVDTNKSFELQIRVAKDLGYANRLLVNDKEVGSIMFSDNAATIAIPSQLLVKGVNVFRIHTDDNVMSIHEKNPDSADVRRLNLAITEIKLAAS